MDQEQDLETKLLTTPVRDPASFRDPSGFVYHLGDEVFRAIDPACSSLFLQLDKSGVLERLERSGGLIPTRLVRRDERVYSTLCRHIPQAREFLHHEKVPFLSYPYEWSVPMLADAAICCLDLQILLTEHGYSLKDASAYNVQFIAARPVFIDVPSIEQVRRRDIWTALNQFYRMFLYPLLLNRYRGVTPKEYFLAHLDGAQPDEVYRRFGFLAAVRPALWMDVWLPAQLQRIATGATRDLSQLVERERADARPLIYNLKRLRRKVRALGARPARPSRWLRYSGDNSYEDTATERKEAFVSGFLAEHRPRRALDLGCNTGRFTQLAAKSGAAVVALDSDAACIDSLYRLSRDERLDVLPLVMDIASPSPGLGFRNAERPAFLGRGSFDCVFALAIVHHLLVTARIPLESIRDLFADLTSTHLVVEFIDPADEMFVRLLGARENIYREHSLDRFLSVFRERFRVLDRASITPHRTLVSLERI